MLGSYPTCIFFLRTSLKFKVQSLKLRADLNTNSKFKVEGRVAVDRNATLNFKL
jgi:hypothetical protein